jgi:hypothetical protein
MITKEALDAALEKASDESMLQEYYRSLVRPLLRMPRSQWPTCCGSICEPCSATLVRVADRTLQLLGVETLSDDEPT